MRNISQSNMDLLKSLLEFSDRYEINIQFWPDQVAVYINKDHVELTSFGGSFISTVRQSTDYLKRINGMS